MAHHNAQLLNQDESVFITIDIQDRLVSAMADNDAHTLIEQTQRLMTAATSLAVPVITTEQYPRGLGNTVSELAEHVQSDSVIEKTSFSCAKVPEFMKKLDATGRKQIVLSGMESHICVLQTALDLLAQGFRVYVVEDAVCSRAHNNKQAALQRMRDAGVIITCMESVLFEWLSDASHPQFKVLSKLVL